MSARVIGIIVGLVLGIVWMSLGFGAAVLTGILAFVGWLIGGIVEGRINIAEVWNDLQGRRGLM
jgi:uncharacterized membrane protein